MVVPRASGVECLGTEPGRERASLGFRVFETLSVPTHVTLHSCFGVPLVGDILQTSYFFLQTSLFLV